jgi:hypothetical protein
MGNAKSSIPGIGLRRNRRRDVVHAGEWLHRGLPEVSRWQVLIGLGRLHVDDVCGDGVPQDVDQDVQTEALDPTVRVDNQWDLEERGAGKDESARYLSKESNGSSH